MATAGSLKVEPKSPQPEKQHGLRKILSILAVLTAAIYGLLGGLNDGWSLLDRLFTQDTKPAPGVSDSAPAAPIDEEGSAPVNPPASEIPVLAQGGSTGSPAPANRGAPGSPAPANSAATGSPAPVHAGVPPNQAPAPAVEGTENTDTPQIATSPAGRFLADLELDNEESVGVRSGTCTTGGRTFSKSLILVVPGGDPALGSYVRADYQVPPGLVKMTATIGLVDEPPHPPNSQVNVFIQSGSVEMYEEKIPVGTASPVSVDVKPGQLLRIQASAGEGERRVCIGAARLDPS